MSESQRITAAAQATETITDSLGRTIEVRRPSRLESMRFTRQWGVACNVEVWIGNAMLGAVARSIDGVPMPAPATADAAERNVDRLGDEGLTAIAEWLQTQGGADADAEKAVSKN